MKPQSDISFEGNLEDVDQTQMTFDPKSSAFLMGLLTNLYSNPAMACVREYSTNAFDSNIAAGNSDPIVVTRPNTMSPVFMVKDQGLGMSLETITEIYSKYGASTKRDSDLFNGMLGLGCKSALSYTSQFTLVSVYDKCRITVLITRNAEGGGMLQIIDQRPTEEKNGVEVQIPVSNSFSFNQQIDEFFQYWAPGSAVGPDGGKLVQSIWDDPLNLHLDDDVIIRTTFDDDCILMGNVAYKVSKTYRHPHHHSRNGYVARVPIGTIKFTPSREALEYKGPTIDTLSEINQFLTHTIIQKIRAEIEGCATPKNAFLKRESFAIVTPSYAIDFKFRGERIPSTVACPVTDEDDRFTSWKLNKKTWESDKSSRAFSENLRFLYLETLFFVTGFKGKALTDTLKQKLKIYAWENFPDPEKGTAKHVVLCASDLKNVMWLENEHMVDIETIKAIVVPKDEFAVGRIIHTADEVRVLNIDGTYSFRKAAKVTMAGWVCLNENSIFKQVGQLMVNLQSLIVVPGSQVAKFQKKYPQVPHIKDLFIDYLPSISTIRRVRAVSVDVFGLVKLLNSVTPCMDFELVSRLNKLKKFQEFSHGTWRDYEWSLECLAAHFGVEIPVHDTSADVEWNNWFFKRYPFLKFVLVRNLNDEIITAINNSYIVNQQLHLINVL